MLTNQRQLADPKTLAQIARLELRARVVVDGVISGMHRSPHRGSSVEFAQHRDYTPGDEIRHIDWKVYARTDRYHVKQFEEETNLRATLVLDSSTSMDYRGEHSPLSKREVASIIAASIASLLLRQRDAVGLATFDNGVRRYIPPASTSAHLKLLLDTLDQIESKPKTGIDTTFHDLAERLKRRGLLIILSDLFADPKTVLRGLSHFRHSKHEVILFHILDRDEMEFPFNNTTRFEGMEGEESILAEPKALQQAYLESFEEFTSTLVHGCRELGMDYHQVCTDQPIDQMLSAYLAKRMNRL